MKDSGSIVSESLLYGISCIIVKEMNVTEGVEETFSVGLNISVAAEFYSVVSGLVHFQPYYITRATVENIIFDNEILHVGAASSGGYHGSPFFSRFTTPAEAAEAAEVTADIYVLYIVVKFIVSVVEFY